MMCVASCGPCSLRKYDNGLAERGGAPPFSAGTHGWFAVTGTLSSFPQSAEVMPPAATKTFDPERAKSVVAPDIASVIAFPSPPVVLIDETTVPAAAEQASVWC